MSSISYTISGFRRRKFSGHLSGTCRKAALHPARTSLPEADCPGKEHALPISADRPLPRRTLGQMLVRKAGVPLQGGDA